METINTIIQHSAAAYLSKWHKRMVLFLFALIIATILGMFIAIFHYGPYLNVQYGY